MKAMILAAGEGRRMRPLTLEIPKPLLRAGEHRLIEYHLYKLAASGVCDVIINIAYLGGEIEKALGEGERYNLNIHYSREPAPLETAGALAHALPALGSEPFLLVNGDIWTDINFTGLINFKLEGDDLGHLVFVSNPCHNPQGDYILCNNKRVELKNDLLVHALTYSGIAVIDPVLISGYPQARVKFPLREVFDWACKRGVLTGEIYDGEWDDIGTPEKLSELNKRLAKRQ